MNENLEIEFNFQKEKLTFTKLFNSPVKRSIIGVFFRIHDEFVTNTNWKSEFYNRLSFTGGKKGKLKRNQINFLINEPQAKESLQFLIDFKLLLPLPIPEDLSSPPLNIDKLIKDFEDYKIFSGIEFDKDPFSTPSGGLRITVGVIHHLLNTLFNVKVIQSKLQSSLDELQSFPSRTNSNHMLIILGKHDAVSKSTSNKDIYYNLNDICYQILNQYHPLPGQVDSNNNGTIYTNLLNKSLSVNQTVAKTAIIDMTTKKMLKLLDSELVFKKTVTLVNEIVLRELIISNFNKFFDRPSRFRSFIKKMDDLSNESELGKQFLKEANLTNNPLPSVFEYLDPYEKPVGVVDEFLTAFSRLYIAQIIIKIISFVTNEHSFIFKPKAGEEIFPLLYNWLKELTNFQLLENIEELVSEASALTEFYIKEDIELISKSFKEQ